jgi:hypothetical protein
MRVIERRAAALLLLIACLLPGCWSSRHIVGTGPTQGIEASEDAWWFFFGFFNLDHPDSASMAANATSYEVIHELSFWDLIIGLPTGYLFARTTVTVRR